LSHSSTTSSSSFPPSFTCLQPVSLRGAEVVEEEVEEEEEEEEEEEAFEAVVEEEDDDENDTCFDSCCNGGGKEIGEEGEIGVDFALSTARFNIVD